MFSIFVERYQNRLNLIILKKKLWLMFFIRLRLILLVCDEHCWQALLNMFNLVHPSRLKYLVKIVVVGKIVRHIYCENLNVNIFRKCVNSVTRATVFRLRWKALRFFRKPFKALFPFLILVLKAYVSSVWVWRL